MADDRFSRLEALRDRLETAILESEANVLPQLAAQYRATLTELSEIAAQTTPSSMVDDLATARKIRKERQRRPTERKRPAERKA